MNVQRTALVLFTALTVMGSLVVSCSDKDNKKNTRSEASCDNGLASGQSQTQTLFSSEFAPFGKTCQDFSFQGTVACEGGNKAFLNGGFATCQETTLQRLRIDGDRKQLEIGQTLALRLTGEDQRGGSFDIDPRLAEWSTNDSTVEVSDSGLVTGTAMVPDVSVTAALNIGSEVLEVTYRLGITGLSCEGTPHGLKKDFTRFKAKKVPFNASCEEVTAQASCNNGKFEFENDVSETCSLAQLTGLIADPSSLFLAEGETAAVFLSLTDELGTRVPVDASAAEWTFPADQLSQSNGQLTALVDLKNDLKVQVKAENFSTEITVSPRVNQPESLRFEQNDLVLKEGDEVDLKVLSVTRGQTDAVDPKRLSWESSAPAEVSVTEGRVKALKAGALAAITAKLDQTSVSTNVKVEEKLGIDAKLIEGLQLSEDKTNLLPAVLATVTGPLKNAAPELKNATEGCTFTIEKNRKVWELDVRLDETRSEIPAACEVEIAIDSAAGQTTSQKVSVPVDYRRFRYQEIRTEGSEGRLEIARLEYKLSRNLKVKSATMTKLLKEEVSPADCQLSTEEKDGVYTIYATREAGKTGNCSGYLGLEIQKENVEESSYHYEMATQSKDKTFVEQCQNPRNESVSATVNAVRGLVGPSASCEKLGEILREKNLYSAAGNDVFKLSLMNQKISNVEPLSRFVGLKELHLAANRDLSDIAPLAELKLLKLLNLKATQVKDFSSIYDHKFMTDLRLPSDARIACSDSITNPELKKVCE